jgi:hypothetical protein
MAVTLHRCSIRWLRAGPCWKVEKALRDMGIEYEADGGPYRPSRREKMQELTGQRLYPAIEFEDGSWYRAESKDMAQAIRDGKLMERAQVAAAPSSG